MMFILADIYSQEAKEMNIDLRDEGISDEEEEEYSDESSDEEDGAEEDSRKETL
ncbi:hypothetical protein FRC19_009317 [Serendipita sp. 401]|nr:hypothetical protein FRC19_009317 [Serendipita sp. 401]